MASPVSGATPKAVAVPVAAEPAETSGKAIASLICGLLFFIPFLFVAAIIFGHLALSEIRKSAGRLKGEGFALAGLVLGYLWIVGIPFVLILSSIAIPNVLRARMAANEASAVGSVRTLMTAEISYAAIHRDAGFTCALSDLAQAGLISTELANGQKSGYKFDLENCAPGPTGDGNGKFQAVAHPLVPNRSGVRAFCVDESGVVKVHSGGSTQECVENGSPLN
jgi:hypothetical protein